MIRIPFIAFSILLAYGCSDKKQIKKGLSGFESFEISYTNGWSESFSFIIDSNKIYHSPQRNNISFYGILPDSIFEVLDTTVLEILKTKRVKSKFSGCVDCHVLYVQVISGGDTIRIDQRGDTDPIFFQLIRDLQNFSDSGKHEIIKTIMFLDTKSIIEPIPPKIIN